MLGPQPKASFGERVEKVLGIVAPNWALSRRTARQLLTVFNRASYRGASRDETKQNWNPPTLSADATLYGEIEPLRNRCRDLALNNPIAAGAIDTRTRNIVGTGIKPQSRINFERAGITEEQAAKLQRDIEYEFERWCKSVTVDGKHTFHSLQELIVRTESTSGEVFLLRRFKERPGNPYKTCWQVIEPDRVATPNGMVESEFLRNGIEIDSDGTPIAYYVCNKHPGDYFGYMGPADYVRIEARDKQGRPNMIHYGKQRRPEQNRYAPWFYPVIDAFAHLGGYMEAEQIANQIAACYALFVKKADPVSAARYASTETQQDTNNQPKRLQKMRPGLIEYLGEGESIEFANPSRPSTQFEVFTDKCTEFIASGLSVLPQMLTNNWAGMNYSSMRGAVLEIRKGWEIDQLMLEAMVCLPIWLIAVEEMHLSGRVQFGDFYGKQYEFTGVEWVAPGWQRIEPMKEAQAQTEALNNNTTTYADVYAERGEDWETQFRQIAREKQLAEELGIEKDLTAAVGAGKSQTAAEEAAKNANS